MSTPTRIIILGGAFGGLYTAMKLEKTLAADRPHAVVSRRRGAAASCCDAWFEIRAFGVRPSYQVK